MIHVLLGNIIIHQASHVWHAQISQPVMHITPAMAGPVQRAVPGNVTADIPKMVIHAHPAAHQPDVQRAQYLYLREQPQHVPNVPLQPKTMMQHRRRANSD